jgi:hypothetical protein
MCVALVCAHFTTQQSALAESGGLVAFSTARRTHIVSLCREPAKRLRYSRLARPNEVCA